MIQVHSGHSRRSLRLVASGGSACPRRGTQVVFSALRGRSYRIAVFGFAGERSFRLRFARVTPPPNDDFANAIPVGLGSSVAGTSRNSTGEPGEPEHGRQTVWFQFSSAAAIDVRVDACNGRRPDLVVYSGSRVNRLTRVVGNSECFAQFEAQPGVTYHIAAVDIGIGGRFQLITRDAMPPANDDFANATPIALGTTISASTRDAGRQPGEPLGPPFTVWFRLTIDTPTSFTLDSCTSELLRLDVYVGDQVDRLVPLARSSGSVCRPTYVAPPRVYNIQASAYHEADFTFTAERATAPTAQGSSARSRGVPE